VNQTRSIYVVYTLLHALAGQHGWLLMYTAEGVANIQTECGGTYMILEEEGGDEFGVVLVSACFTLLIKYIITLTNY